MKKNLTRILLLVAALVLALGMAAHAEDVAAAPEAEAVSTNAFIFWQDEDWWPAVTQFNDDYWAPAPVAVTGEGYYTASVTGHMPGWFYSGGNKNIGAQKLALIIPDGSTLFPGMYLQVTEVRIDGVSYPCGDVTYGTTGYENVVENKVIWDADDTYALLWDQWMIDNAGSIGDGTTWNSAATAQKFDVFDVSVLKNPKTIEIDFFLSAQQDVKPAGGPALRVLGEGPSLLTYMAEATNADEVPPTTDAYLGWIDSDWWPMANDHSNDYWTPIKAEIVGEGHYTVGINAHMPGWFVDQGFTNTGAQKLAVVINDGSQKFPNMYMQITDFRIDGESQEIGNVTYGTAGYSQVDDSGNVLFTEADTYGLIYDQHMIDYNASIGDGVTWDSSATAHNYNILDVSKLKDPSLIEVDFFLSAAQDVVPGATAVVPEIIPEYDFVWYPDNTMGVAGYSLRDKGITDKWYNVCPVNLTKDGIYKVPMVASNTFVIGNAIVTVSGDDVTVTYEPYGASPGSLTVNSECVKWFKSIDEITDEFCDAPTSEIAFGDVVSKAELGDVAYLFICNGVTYCQPITADGIMLPAYYPGNNAWKAYRAGLDEMVASLTAVEEAPAAEEVPAE